MRSCARRPRTARRLPLESEQARRQAPLALLHCRDESPASPLVRLLLLGASRRLDQPFAGASFGRLSTARLGTPVAIASDRKAGARRPRIQRAPRRSSGDGRPDRPSTAQGGAPGRRARSALAESRSTSALWRGRRSGAASAADRLCRQERPSHYPSRHRPKGIGGKGSLEPNTGRIDYATVRRPDLELAERSWWLLGRLVQGPCRGLPRQPRPRRPPGFPERRRCCCSITSGPEPGGTHDPARLHQGWREPRARGLQGWLSEEPRLVSQPPSAPGHHRPGRLAPYPGASARGQCQGTQAPVAGGGGATAATRATSGTPSARSRS